VHELSISVIRLDGNLVIALDQVREYFKNQEDHHKKTFQQECDESFSQNIDLRNIKDNILAKTNFLNDLHTPPAKAGGNSLEIMNRKYLFME